MIRNDAVVFAIAMALLAAYAADDLVAWVRGEPPVLTWRPQ